MKAKNIRWDIDMEGVLESLDDLSLEEAAKLLKVPYEKYAKMSFDERDDFAEDYFRHNPGALLELVDLPVEVELPEDLTDEEDISDWLSDEYGFCHDGFELES